MTYTHHKAAAVSGGGSPKRKNNRMPLFRGRETKAQIAVSQPVAKAAAAGVPNWSPNMAGPNMIGQYYSYQEG